jgi:hypothetical protein
MNAKIVNGSRREFSGLREIVISLFENPPIFKT